MAKKRRKAVKKDWQKPLTPTQRKLKDLKGVLTAFLVIMTVLLLTGNLQGDPSESKNSTIQLEYVCSLFGSHWDWCNDRNLEP